MKVNKLYIIALIFLFMVNACTNLAEGMTGTKRSKSSDEFFVHKKKPLVLPPDFNDMPMPKPNLKKQTQTVKDIDDIENLLRTEKKTNNNISQSSEDKSLENSIIKKINKN